MSLLSKTVCAATLVLALAGCATWQPPSDISDAGLRERAVSATNREVRVSAAVLSAADSRRMFGTDLTQYSIQVVWIEVRNQTRQPLWLLRPGTDPDYYSPLEVAWALHQPLAEEINTRIDEHFEKLGFQNPIEPSATRAGVLFTHPQHGTKLVNIDLFATKTLIPFTLFLPVPDDAQNPNFARSLYRYPNSEITDYKDLAALRPALERLRCCATDVNGTGPGDPVNGVLVGRLPDVASALVRRGYHRDTQTVDRVQRVFGREPDFVLRKQAQGGSPATWIRGWLTPISFERQDVYLIQVGRPVGGRFAPKDSESTVLHDDVDEARNLFIQDAMYSGGLSKLGFVSGVGPACLTAPRTTFGGAHYHTDGLRAVLFFAARPISLSDVEMLDWVPFLERGEGSVDPCS